MNWYDNVYDLSLYDLECLTSDEKEALNAMEKLLAKAQKARTLQKKASENLDSL